MNRKWILVLGMLGWLTLPLAADAAEPSCRWFGSAVPDCIGKWCCDDYDAKSLPCVDVPLCFGCDDYCPKALPCGGVPLCFQCDDYCPKCLPPTCSSPLLEHLRCGPPPASCRCSGRCDRCEPAPKGKCGLTSDGVVEHQVAREETSEAAIKRVMVSELNLDFDANREPDPSLSRLPYTEAGPTVQQVGAEKPVSLRSLLMGAGR